MRRWGLGARIISDGRDELLLLCVRTAGALVPTVLYAEVQGKGR